jgi:hypothetical protein
MQITNIVEFYNHTKGVKVQKAFVYSTEDELHEKVKDFLRSVGFHKSKNTAKVLKLQEVHKAMPLVLFEFDIDVFE